MNNPAIVVDAILVAALVLGGLFYGTWDRLRTSRAGRRLTHAEADRRAAPRHRPHPVPFPAGHGARTAARRRARPPAVSPEVSPARRALGRCPERR